MLNCIQPVKIIAPTISYDNTWYSIHTSCAQLFGYCY